MKGNVFFIKKNTRISISFFASVLYWFLLILDRFEQFFIGYEMLGFLELTNRPLDRFLV